MSAVSQVAPPNTQGELDLSLAPFLLGFEYSREEGRFIKYEVYEYEPHKIKLTNLIPPMMGVVTDLIDKVSKEVFGRLNPTSYVQAPLNLAINLNPMFFCDLSGKNIGTAAYMSKWYLIQNGEIVPPGPFD